MARSSEKVYKKAEDVNRLQDEEQAYVLYMKYCNLVSAVKKSSEFKKNGASCWSLLRSDLETKIWHVGKMLRISRFAFAEISF